MGKSLNVVGSHSKKVATAAGMGSVLRRKRAGKGRLVPPARLSSNKFRKSLRAAVSEMGIDLWSEFGLKSVEALQKILIEARARTDQKMVTVARWTGSAWEVIAPKLPEVVKLEQSAHDEFVRFANGYVAEQHRGLRFVNGNQKKVVVKTPFAYMSAMTTPTKPGSPQTHVIHGVRIKMAHEKTGVEWFERGKLSENHDRQALAGSVEFKTRGAAKDLRRQIAQRTERMRVASKAPGTVVTYRIEGKSGLFETKFEDLIFLPGPADFFSKFAVRAGKKFRADVVQDANGDPYIRVIVASKTDLLRRLIERVHRDKSWR